ncbi:MAG: DNA-3-methyladenine glycosylase [Anaerolineae bacterium]|jgi:DNA-3-methyladenine glycosylase|nr:DNA-3-methyladenine glycosylase [Anaerolineae bacterium]MBT4309917.1 DNA-3-methyladenine glycosylase [Anaerolineae bacterium]MBT4457833.1 DNA-3-methyladenine glycosylase [Anaerolineae bacterium]MBT4841828.1 DNA-3-methyladenine glycosylase [Anaerolineae bacterium]MBT6061750.1 DNA-3-methyladenine glycosylase [Anaerolineae bacterium]
MDKRILPHEFYDRPTLTVAQELLGATLVRVEKDVQIAGIIVETEAYVGESDLGCHAKAGKTPRTAIMYGMPGRAYVYFTYGMHWMLNAVTEAEGFPAAVLIRAIHPTEGVEIIASRRGKQPRTYWTDGPAKLTQALAIDKSFNGIDLCNSESGLWIESGKRVLEKNVTTSARVGLYTVPEPWKSKPWRFQISTL